MKCSTALISRRSASRVPRTFQTLWLALLCLLYLSTVPVSLAQEAQEAGSSNSQSISNVDSTAPLSRDQERQVQRIGAKIHCPICSGESIAQSQTDISRQMMNEVRAMVSRGVGEKDILAQFVASYGERILMEPPKRGVTSLLWTLPVVFLVSGVLWWVSYLKRSSRPLPRPLTPEDEQRIADLLAERR